MFVHFLQIEEKLIDEDNEDSYILSKIADILHALFATHQSELFPFFETLLPHYVKLLVSFKNTFCLLETFYRGSRRI